MRFQVPQFIDVEDKIFGPLTFKQFVYLVGGGGLSFVLWKLLPTFIAVLFIGPILILTLALAFYKVNNKPFIATLQAAISYVTKSKIYIWKKAPPELKARKKHGEEERNVADEVFIPRMSESKLEDISWSLGVKESLYAEEMPSRRPLPTEPTVQSEENDTIASNR